MYAHRDRWSDRPGIALIPVCRFCTRSVRGHLPSTFCSTAPCINCICRHPPSSTTRIVFLDTKGGMRNVAQREDAIGEQTSIKPRSTYTSRRPAPRRVLERRQQNCIIVCRTRPANALHSVSSASSRPTCPFQHWTIRYDTIQDAILTCARKPTWVSLFYRTETTT